MQELELPPEPVFFTTVLTALALPGPGTQMVVCIFEVMWNEK